MSLSHILQEAIASYSKAYECYRSAGDEPHVGKAVEKIAEVMCGDGEEERRREVGEEREKEEREKLGGAEVRERQRGSVGLR